MGDEGGGELRGLLLGVADFDLEDFLEFLLGCESFDS